MPGLRKEIAKYVYKKRDIKCVPEQVVIQSGTQAALRKLASLFNESDACVAVEDPGYNIARDAKRDTRSNLFLCIWMR